MTPRQQKRLDAAIMKSLTGGLKVHAMNIRDGGLFIEARCGTKGARFMTVASVSKGDVTCARCRAKLSTKRSPPEPSALSQELRRRRALGVRSKK
jgi:hypothetical protein